MTVLDRNALVGKTARRTLLPGLPIAANAVGEPKIVTIGAMVRVVFVEGGLTITTYASALQAGVVGDVDPGAQHRKRPDHLGDDRERRQRSG